MRPTEARVTVHPPLEWLRPKKIAPQDLVPKLRFQTGMLMRRYQRRLASGRIGPRGRL